MSAPVLSLAPFTSPGNAVYDLTGLTGGVGRTDGVLGFTGADYIWSENAGYASKTMGGDQARYVWFDDNNLGMGTGGYSNGVGSIDFFATAQDYHGIDGAGEDVGGTVHKSNWLGINLTGAEQGIRWTPIANRTLKHLLVAFETTGGNYEVNASLSDGSVADQQILITGTGQRWFTCDWKANSFDGQDKALNLEVRRKSVGAGTIWVAFAYIGIPIAEKLPQGLGKFMAYTGHFGGANNP